MEMLNLNQLVEQTSAREQFANWTPKRNIIIIDSPNKTNPTSKCNAD